MNNRQLLSAIGELDERIVLAASQPPRRHRVVYAWAVAAAAVVVIGVLGYVGLLQSQQNKPPVSDPIPPVVTGTTTASTGNDLPPLVYDRFWGSNSGGLGGSGDVTAFSFEELQIQSLTEVPATAPVYTARYEDIDEASEQEALIRQYTALVGDTLTDTVRSEHVLEAVRSEATGEKFHYTVQGRTLESGHVYMELQPRPAITVDPSSDLLAQIVAACPALFADMEEPTLFCHSGTRHWGRDSETKQLFVFDIDFSYEIYDAAKGHDVASKWLNSVGVHVYEGKLIALTVKQPLDKVADYPILSLEEAYAELRELYAPGKFTSLVNENYQVMSVELVYFSNSASTLRVPCYRFLLTANETYFGKNLYDQAGALLFHEVVIPAVSEEYWAEEETGVSTTVGTANTSDPYGRTTSTAKLVF